MTCQCDRTVELANRRRFIAGLACTAILPMAANAQLAGSPTTEDVTFMRMAIEEARLAVNFQEVVHSVLTRNSDVAKRQ